MSRTRREQLVRLGFPALLAMAARLRAAQLPEEQNPRPHLPSDREPDPRLPNGKSQKDAIAKENHQHALDDADELLRLATDLKQDLEKAGDFVVPVNSLKRTEEIEKLARRIRGRLKG